MHRGTDSHSGVVDNGQVFCALFVPPVNLQDIPAVLVFIVAVLRTAPWVSEMVRFLPSGVLEQSEQEAL